MTEFMHGVTDRRTFLKRLSAVGAATIVGTTTDMFTRPMTAWASPGAASDTVIVNIFLRGGADSLGLVIPHGDNAWGALRPNLAPAYTDLDGFFGLSAELQPLYGHFNEGRLAIVHAAGSPVVDRSHFSAQPKIDTGLSSTGWLQRALQQGDSQTGEFDEVISGLTIGSRVGGPLRGPWGGTVVTSLQQTSASGMNLALAEFAIKEMHEYARFPLDQTTVTNAFISIDQVTSIVAGQSGPYPDNGFAADLREAATLIKADIGVRGVSIDVGGWDTHFDQVPRLQYLNTMLSSALDAFQNDLGSASNRVITVVCTEFGRSVKQKGSGTDHGYGGLMMVMGEPMVNTGGGKVHAQWPGLSDGDLVDNRDLDVTTDFRTVLAELVDNHLGVDPSSLFSAPTDPYLGLLEPAVPGDVNASGSIDADDANAILNNMVGNPQLPFHSDEGDFDVDGDADLLDALRLAQKVSE